MAKNLTIIPKLNFGKNPLINTSFGDKDRQRFAFPFLAYQ